MPFVLEVWHKEGEELYGELEGVGCRLGVTPSGPLTHVERRGLGAGLTRPGAAAAQSD